MPLVLGVRDGHEQRTVGPGDDDLRVKEEWHHDILTVPVEVAEVCKEARVGDGDGLAGCGDGFDQLLRRSPNVLVAPQGVCGRHTVEAIGCETVECVSKTLRLGMLRSEGARAIGPRDSVA